MQGHTMQQDYYLSDGVKALIVAYVKDKSEENLIKAFSEFGRQNQLSVKEIKHIVIDEFRTELNKLLTREEFYSVLKAELEKLRAELRGEIAELRTELKQDIADVRTELKQEIAELKVKGLYWLIGTGIAVVITTLSGVWAMNSFMIEVLRNANP